MRCATWAGFSRYERGEPGAGSVAQVAMATYGQTGYGSLPLTARSFPVRTFPGEVSS